MALMALLDLFALAAANDATLEIELQTRQKACPTDHATRINIFCQTVREHGSVSINMKPWRMRSFLERGRYLSVYELAAERAAASGRSAEDELRDHQRAYYERRVLFDRSFKEGERFLYGALNIGGAGVDYGVFCVVLDADAAPALPMAFLPENSLDRYVKPATHLTLDEAALRREAATPAQKHSVAALKHTDDLATLEAPAWAAMVCSGERFVEALFIGDLTWDRIEEIRLKQDDMQRLSDLALDAMLGKVATEDLNELDDFDNCMKRLRSLGRVA